MKLAWLIGWIARSVDVVVKWSPCSSPGIAAALGVGGEPQASTASARAMAAHGVFVFSINPSSMRSCARAAAGMTTRGGLTAALLALTSRGGLPGRTTQVITTAVLGDVALDVLGRAQIEQAADDQHHPAAGQRVAQGVGTVGRRQLVAEQADQGRAEGARRDVREG